MAKFNLIHIKLYFDTYQNKIGAAQKLVCAAPVVLLDDQRVFGVGGVPKLLEAFVGDADVGLVTHLTGIAVRDVDAVLQPHIGMEIEPGPCWG